MEKRISIVIPNFNMAATIGKCLEAAFASKYSNFEVIVVDDYSDDSSIEIIEKHPCKLIRLKKRSGTSIARNTGANNSSGDLIFFIDADCLVLEDTLSIINSTFSGLEPGIVIGGTYTRMPYDKRFCSIFQSVFVNYFETKRLEDVDYIAAHAMVIDALKFRESGGYPDFYLPIIEDVAYGHKLRAMSCRLVMNPKIQVRHIFNFSIPGSIRNAFRKSYYWCLYSLKAKDMFADSGCASFELKADVALNFLSILFLLLWALTQNTLLLTFLPAFFILNVFMNKGLIKAFQRTKGTVFAVKAFLYYSMIYPLPIGVATITAILKHLFGKNGSGSQCSPFTVPGSTFDCKDNRV
ncbi:poly-beta-1,6-N-acetyl-D-glucosamine synthase [bacterium BMS3Bbin09]|nr:poly-beta-1,6-N-acetyl-D-glucosamine synthase [bacterium BMS3Bbin09]HDH33933.1 glycosyltransferase [Nitrospirota bacterium]HDN95347.1 glycosyltransferase [Nitrospirota bacterium]